MAAQWLRRNVMAMVGIKCRYIYVYIYWLQDKTKSNVWTIERHLCFVYITFRLKEGTEHALLSFVYYPYKNMFCGCILLHISNSLHGIDPSVKLHLTLDSCDESGSVTFEVS